MFKARWIRWKNLNSYGNFWTQIDLDYGDSVAIVGKNGGGKSTFLDALFLNLTGEPYRKISKNGLVNSINNKDCLTEGLYEANGSEYLVRVGLKPSIFEIYKDGKMLDRFANVKDQWKFFHEHILGMRPKTIRQVVALGSATFTPFMQLSAGERRQVVEDILDVTAFGPMADIVKRLASNARSRISEARERERILEERERGKVELLKRAKATQAERVAEIEQDIAHYTSRLNDLIADHDKYVETTTGLQWVVDKKQELEKGIATGRRLIDKINVKLEGVKRLLKELRAPAPKCTYCGQEFPKDGVDQKIEEAEAEERALSEQEDEIAKGLTNMNCEIVQYTDFLHEYTNAISSAISVKNEIKMIGGEIKRLQSRLDTFKAQDADLPAIEAEIEQVRREIKEKLEKLEEDQHLLKHWNACAELLRDDGVKAKVVRTYLPLINQLVNKYLEQMEFNVSFYLDETFEETIKSRGRDAFSYYSFSEGEKQRIDLALLFTWMEIARIKNSVNTNFLILDEIGGGSLDEDGVRDFTKLLRGLDGVSSFVISHNPHFETALDRVLEAAKQKGFSQLTEKRT